MSAGNNSNSSMNAGPGDHEALSTSQIPTIDVVGVDDDEQERGHDGGDGNAAISTRQGVPAQEAPLGVSSQAPRASGQDDALHHGLNQNQNHTADGALGLTMNVPRILTSDDADANAFDNVDAITPETTASLSAVNASSGPSTPAAGVSSLNPPGSPSQPQGILLNVPNTPHSRARSGSDSGSIHFSPTLGRAPSPSPSRTVYGDDTSTLAVPPSPTLSAVSSNSENPPGPTTMALRDNQPNAASGMSSLQLLHPQWNNNQGGHMRRSSAGTFTTLAASEQGTQEPGSPTSTMGPHSSHSRRTSVTMADMKGRDGDVDSPTSPSKAPGKEGKDVGKGESNPSRGGSEEQTEEGSVKKISLDADGQGDVDTGPFPSHFQPKRLAALVDPKSMESLQNLGGLDGLLEGLGTDAKRGLCGFGKDPGHDAAAAADAEGEQHGHHLNHLNPKRSSSGDDSGGGGGHGDSGGSPHTASLGARRQIYGANMLPPRPSKSLLQLMWLAFKDKVMLMLTVAAVVSFALGLFQDFGTSRPTFSCGNGQTCEEPPVDWVEGVYQFAFSAISGQNC